MNNTHVINDIIKMHEDGATLDVLKHTLVNRVADKTDFAIYPHIKESAFTASKVTFDEMGKLVAFVVFAQMLEAHGISHPQDNPDESFKLMGRAIELVQNTMGEINEALLGFATDLVSHLGHQVQTVEIKLPTDEGDE